MSADLIEKFFEQLAASVGATIAQLTSSEIAHEVVLNQEQPGNDLWASFVLHRQSSHQITIGYAQKTGLQLARAMLAEVPGDETALSAEDEELLAEFWRQAAGRASTDMKHLLADSPLEYVDARPTDSQPAAWATLSLKSEKLSCALTARVSMEFVRSLANPQPEVKASNPEPPLAANNLDLLLNVPLAVSLRFGQQKMPLRNILQLTSGSVIELDRQAEDPVDLLLNERLIARGQVVVVDGCYGLRVTEVCR